MTDLQSSDMRHIM